ncbi:urokinase plasminogen activator surface receptor isoform X2 [Choloepus didactylus]|uniref:urokinase plasminogen activator surface receptor isoform X2 n=1 Tax=Choloepus didactylus TaxID=27675 RepID=UPI00189E79A8|nr:urokinase plasminogen activator surface receptor isoform X2 [Choloepus didactylus]
MGRPLPLPLLLLLAHICIPASWGLRCMLCERSGHCQEGECPPGQDLCRTTILRIWEGGEELEVVERGCAHREKDNRTMTYRTGVQIITLIEAVCGSDLCNQPKPGSSGDERYSRGCGYISGCPGPTGFHNDQTFHFLQCCNTTKCNGGPVLELQKLPLNGLQCYSCEGNSTHGCSREETSLISCHGPMNQCLKATGSKGLGTPNYTVRGCATPSWCQSLHVADGFSLIHPNVSCCTGNGCNHPIRDIQPRRGTAPRPGPAQLSFTFTLLMTARLWGGTLLWT